MASGVFGSKNVYIRLRDVKHGSCKLFASVMVCDYNVINYNFYFQRYKRLKIITNYHKYF